MLGHLWLSEAERADEVVDRSLAAREGVEDLPPPRLGDGVEGVGCGRGPCHCGEYIFLYRNRSTECLAERVKQASPAVLAPGGFFAPVEEHALFGEHQSGSAVSGAELDRYH